MVGSNNYLDPSKGIFEPHATSILGNLFLGPPLFILVRFFGAVYFLFKQGKMAAEAGLERGAHMGFPLMDWAGGWQVSSVISGVHAPPLCSRFAPRPGPFMRVFRQGGVGSVRRYQVYHYSRDTHIFLFFSGGRGHGDRGNELCVQGLGDLYCSLKSTQL